MERDVREREGSGIEMRNRRRTKLGRGRKIGDWRKIGKYETKAIVGGDKQVVLETDYPVLSRC